MYRETRSFLFLCLKLFQLWLTFGASLAFLIIGLVRGYSSSSIPSMESLNPDIIQHSEQKSWIGAIPPLGAFFGSMCSGPLMQRAGRKRTLQLTAPLWGASWLILGFAPNFPVILLGRILSGFCVGFVLAPAQVYVSECCDPEIRGRLGSLPTLSMSLGILIPYVAGNWLSWRYLAFFSALFCAALFFVLLPLPESPVWLKSRGLDDALAIKWLHLSHHAIATVKNDDEENNEKVEEPKSLFTREVFFSSSVMRPLIVGFALLFFQQFSGIDAVIFFTVEIFQKAGSSLNPSAATVIVGVVQLISSGVSTMLVDRSGRRPLLLISALTMCASMLSMGCAFFFEFEKNSFLGYLPIASLVVFMVGFSLGFGGLPFLLLGELFPTHYRSQLSAMASAVNLLSMFTVIKSYHALDRVLTSAGTFWMYSAFCAVAFFFVIFMVPETKGKSLAEIEQHFRGKKTKEPVNLQSVQSKF
ncbi:facilitated trehalose transporter Tret1-like [Melitaea cinxia]|uniref:facilitated trehalose transporter Tret1-like n=1 Tax=Melitaea cinxia TaxID=113334 RepID=UPI001E26EB84|nr:facilitated trehalose transporter Tret1-like [Melitaea cinxia]